MAMINYVTEIRFGAGSAAELAQVCQALGFKKPLFITDKGVMLAQANQDARRGMAAPIAMPATDSLIAPLRSAVSETLTRSDELPATLRSITSAPLADPKVSIWSPLERQIWSPFSSAATRSETSRASWPWANSR